MFDPDAVKLQGEKRNLLNELSRKCYLLVPEEPKELRQGLMLFTKEVQCGDPDCSPIDTIVTLVWGSNDDSGKGMFGLPFPPEQITDEILKDHFPDKKTLVKWHKGLTAFWNSRYWARRRQQNWCQFIFYYFMFVGESVMYMLNIRRIKKRARTAGTNETEALNEKQT